MKSRKKITLGLAVLAVMVLGALWGTANAATIYGQVNISPTNNPDVMVYLRPLGFSTSSADIFYTPDPYNSDGKGVGHYEFLNVADGTYILTVISVGSTFNVHTVTIVNNLVAKIDNQAAASPPAVNFAVATTSLQGTLTPVNGTSSSGTSSSGTSGSGTSGSGTSSSGTSSSGTSGSGTGLSAGAGVQSLGARYPNVTNGQVAGNGVAYYAFILDAPTYAVEVDMLSSDWATNQDLIVSPVRQPKCSDIVGVQMQGPTFWYNPIGTSNETVTIGPDVQAGTIYVTVCNRSAGTGKFQMYWNAY